MSEIDALDLTASLMEVEGLNLGARELLPGRMIHRMCIRAFVEVCAQSSASRTASSSCVS